MFRFADRIGEPDPDYLASKMPFPLWREWLEFFGGGEPIGEEREDWRAAIIAQTVSNTVRGLFGGEPQPIGDFIPQFTRDKKKEPIADDEGDRESARSALRAFGAMMTEGACDGPNSNGQTERTDHGGPA